MAADTVKLVDSVVASPGVRLDLNDGVQWWTVEFSAPPPRLRRAVSSNAMRDGVHVSSSQYDARTLTLTLQLIHDTQDDNAAQLQALARELDRPDNFLMYQPVGATKPVFFRLFRSDFSAIVDVRSQKAMREMTVELMAEPFALGLRETLGPYTVTNDPAAASNGCYFDVTGVIGDVDSPCVLVNTTASRGFGVMAVRQHGTPANLTFFKQAESNIGVGADTTNPGGGPDAAMSGTGTNNYMRTTFATDATLVSRLLIQWGTSEMRGRYNVYAAVRRTDNTSVIRVGVGPDSTTPTTTTLPLTTSRVLVYMGQWSSDVVPSAVGYATLSGNWDYLSQQMTVYAARTSGAGSLDWDCFYLLPADESTLVVENSAGTSSTGYDDVWDGYGESASWVASGSDPFGSTPVQMTPASGAAGSFPALVPNQTNRLYWLSANGPNRTHTKTDTDAWTVYYWPRYLFVRPSAT